MIFNRPNAILKVNQYASEGRPFLIICDFEANNCIIEKLETIDSQVIKYKINQKRNFSKSVTNTPNIILEKYPISFESYEKAFLIVKKNIFQGNSFLTNLTCQTPINLNISLLEVFERSRAKYKLHIKDKFVCFSPEIFLKINDRGKLSLFPMKGTIDAALPNAEQVILGDKKEFYEHITIVDLIRNDLSKVCEQVWVEKFRYIDKIKTFKNNELLQVSSQVSGLLSNNWKEKLGSILFKMLPAGSILGAPKNKTLEIIRDAEKITYAAQFGELASNRGFYTGIMGIFDGESFDSGVMIRFIEKTKNGLVFKSGGGITANSIAKNEYDEMIQKIYVPII